MEVQNGIARDAATGRAEDGASDGLRASSARSWRCRPTAIEMPQPHPKHQPGSQPLLSAGSPPGPRKPDARPPPSPLSSHPRLPPVLPVLDPRLLGSTALLRRAESLPLAWSPFQSVPSPGLMMEPVLMHRSRMPEPMVSPRSSFKVASLSDDRSTERSFRSQGQGSSHSARAKTHRDCSPPHPSLTSSSSSVVGLSCGLPSTPILRGSRSRSLTVAGVMESLSEVQPEGGGRQQPAQAARAAPPPMAGQQRSLPLLLRSLLLIALLAGLGWGLLATLSMMHGYMHGGKNTTLGVQLKSSSEDPFAMAPASGSGPLSAYDPSADTGQVSGSDPALQSWGYNTRQGPPGSQVCWQ